MLQLKNFIFIFALLISSMSHATSVKAIIFDCDGTLIDNGNQYFLDWQYALQRQGYELASEKFWHFMNKNRLVGASRADEMLVKYCCELLGRDCTSELQADKNFFSKQLQANYDFPPIEATLSFLHQLAKEKEHFGLKLGLASGGTREHILRTLNRLGLATYFDVIVSGADDLASYHDPEGTNKPKPYVYLQAAKILGLCPEQCVAVEDSLAGISSAINAGCIAVAVPNTYTIKQDLSCAHLKIVSFEGISPADFLRTITNIAFVHEN